MNVDTSIEKIGEAKMERIALTVVRAVGSANNQNVEGVQENIGCNCPWGGDCAMSVLDKVLLTAVSVGGEDVDQRIRKGFGQRGLEMKKEVVINQACTGNPPACIIYFQSI